MKEVRRRDKEKMGQKKRPLKMENAERRGCVVLGSFCLLS